MDLNQLFCYFVRGFYQKLLVIRRDLEKPYKKALISFQFSEIFPVLWGVTSLRVKTWERVEIFSNTLSQLSPAFVQIIITGFYISLRMKKF